MLLGQFAASCEISTSKSKAMVLDLKNMASYLQVSREPKPQVEKFKNHGVLYVSEGRMEQQIVAAVSSTGWPGAPLELNGGALPSGWSLE